MCLAENQRFRLIYCLEAISKHCSSAIKIIGNLFFISARPNISYNCILFRFSRPNPLQYFLVPDIEVENGDDDEDVEDEEEVGAFQFET